MHGPSQQLSLHEVDPFPSLPTPEVASFEGAVAASGLGEDKKEWRAAWEGGGRLGRGRSQEGRCPTPHTPGYRSGSHHFLTLHLRDGTVF